MTEILYIINLNPPCSQVFEDGSSYRGRLKLLGRTIVKSYYDATHDDIEVDHNSDQAVAVIKDKVTAILQDSSFLRATEPDENVSFKNPFTSWSYSHAKWLILSID